MKWSGSDVIGPIPIDLIECAKLHVRIGLLVLKYAKKIMNLLLKGTRVRWSAELFCIEKVVPHFKNV